MPWPDMEVIWVEEETRLSIIISPCRNFELHIIVSDIFLLVIHSLAGGIKVSWHFWQLRAPSPRHPHHLASDI